jgi:hypothetical protein
MNKLLLAIMLVSLLQMECGRDPDVVIEGCCNDTSFSFKDDAGRGTIAPRYRLIVDGQSYLVDGATYFLVKVDIPCKLKLEYWFEDDGDWTMDVYIIGDCDED